MESKEKFLLASIRQKLVSSVNQLKNRQLIYSGNLTVDNLSELLNVSLEETISFFWNQDEKIKKNQVLSDELVAIFCQSKKIQVIKKDKQRLNVNEVITEYLTQIDKEQFLEKRPPIISIMGHVDHGKTTLLDTIQQTQNQKKEAGGITQKISVSQVEFRGEKITFCDTPGHRIFMQMRQRGIYLTDLVVLVVSAEDGVMPQTVEIIEYIHQHNLPVIVFLNHKKSWETNNETNLQKIKGQLQKQGLTFEDWGGNVVLISGSVKEKKDVEILLKNISDFSKSLKGNFQRSADGVIIDSYLSREQGSTTNLLIQGGKIQERDWLVVGGREGKVKRILDKHNKIIKQASIGEVVKVIGLDFLVEPGEKFLVINEREFRKEMTNLINYQKDNQSLNFVPNDTVGKKNIKLILIADSQGALEVLETIIKQESSSLVNFQILYKKAGILNDYALNLVKDELTYLILFTKLSSATEKKLKESKVKWFSSEIIYQIEEELEKIAKVQQEKKKVEKETGTAKVTEVFFFSKGNIAGCQVTNGTISRKDFVKVVRQGKIIATDKIHSLESKNIALSEVRRGQECGITLNKYQAFQINDQIYAYRIVEENVNEKNQPK